MRGQYSLEAMLVMSVMFGAFIMLVPIANSLMEGARIAAGGVNAKQFLRESSRACDSALLSGVPQAFEFVFVADGSIEYEESSLYYVVNNRSYSNDGVFKCRIEGNTSRGRRQIMVYSGQ